jgi:hypothetical protein
MKRAIIHPRKDWKGEYIVEYRCETIYMSQVYRCLTTRVKYVSSNLVCILIFFSYERNIRLKIAAISVILTEYVGKGFNAENIFPWITMQMFAEREITLNPSASRQP